MVFFNHKIMKNIFTKEVSDEIITRINSLTKDTQPLWGKMSVAQMLAHCNVTYELVYEQKHAKPNPIVKFILKTFVKKIVTNDKPYKKGSQTAPYFVISDSKDFENEKSRLIAYIEKTQELGEAKFDGKESHSFGVMNKQEWNAMFWKHLDHHLKQFNV